MNIEVFYMSGGEFLSADPNTWMAERMHDEQEGSITSMFEAAVNLEGYYWWTCAPGCLPDSEAIGPFDLEDEAWEDAEND